MKKRPSHFWLGVMLIFLAFLRHWLFKDSSFVKKEDLGSFCDGIVTGLTFHWFLCRFWYDR